MAMGGTNRPAFSNTAFRRRFSPPLFQATAFQAVVVDFWDAYQKVFATGKHHSVSKDSGETTHVERFVLDLPLLRLDVEPGRIAGEYRAVVDGGRVLHVRVPEGAHILAASVGHSPGPVVWDAQGVMLTLTFKAGQSVPFEVRWDTHEVVMPPDVSRVLWRSPWACSIIRRINAVRGKK